VDWKLPAGWSAGSIRWPAPERIVAGGVVGYGYSGPEMLLQTLTPPGTLKGASTVVLRGRVRWLTCTPEMCRPAKGDFQLSLPVTLGDPVPNAAWRRLFEEAAAKVPPPLTTRPIDARVAGGDVVLTIGGDQPLLKGQGKPYFFPAAAGMVSHSKVQTMSLTKAGTVIRLPLSEDSLKPPSRLIGVLKAPPGARFTGQGSAVFVDVPIKNAPENKHE
jgi:thiol:disulfide interchange protein DsbD